MRTKYEVHLGVARQERERTCNQENRTVIQVDPRPGNRV
jgi:hypothetical protein